jgi:hypothetical protein
MKYNGYLKLAKSNSHRLFIGLGEGTFHEHNRRLSRHCSKPRSVTFLVLNICSLLQMVSVVSGCNVVSENYIVSCHRRAAADDIERQHRSDGRAVPWFRQIVSMWWTITINTYKIVSSSAPKTTFCSSYMKLWTRTHYSRVEQSTLSFWTSSEIYLLLAV